MNDDTGERNCGLTDGGVAELRAPNKGAQILSYADPSIATGTLAPGQVSEDFKRPFPLIRRTPASIGKLF